VVLDAPYVLAGEVKGVHLTSDACPEHDWSRPGSTSLLKDRLRVFTLEVADVVRQPAGVHPVKPGDLVRVHARPLHFLHLHELADPGDTVLFLADPHPANAEDPTLVVSERALLAKDHLPVRASCDAVAREVVGAADCGLDSAPYVVGVGLPPGKRPGEALELTLVPQLSKEDPCAGMAWAQVLDALRELPQPAPPVETGR
jgi:hypothetical protein